MKFDELYKRIINEQEGVDVDSYLDANPFPRDLDSFLRAKEQRDRRNKAISNQLKHTRNWYARRPMEDSPFVKMMTKRIVNREPDLSPGPQDMLINHADHMKKRKEEFQKKYRKDAAAEEKRWQLWKQDNPG